jgi:CheY-like chemotaxis protein
LADDSPIFRKVAARLLDSEPRIKLVGFAESGLEALAQVTALHPDLVLMDWLMPELDGLEATRRLKTRDDAPLVLMVSSHDSPEYREASATYADGYLVKTHCAALLVPSILRLMEQRLSLSA